MTRPPCGRWLDDADFPAELFRFASFEHEAGQGGVAVGPDPAVGRAALRFAVSLAPRSLDAIFVVVDLTRTNVLHLCLSAVESGFVDQVAQWVWVGVDGLLQEPVEQQPSCGGVAAVESERELVEVVRQVLGACSVMQGACMRQ